MLRAALVFICVVPAIRAQTLTIEPVPENLRKAFRRNLAITHNTFRVFSLAPEAAKQGKCSVRLREVPRVTSESWMPIIKPRRTEKPPLAELPAPPCPKPE